MGTAVSSRLASSLFGKTRRALLALFLGDPNRSLYLREAVREAGVSLSAGQREIIRLSKAGVLVAERRGHQSHYRANHDCPIFAELQALFAKTAGLADVVQEALEPLRPTIRLAFVYGSQAAGTSAASSDVDLLVVGNPDELALHKAIARAENTLHRPVNYTLMSYREFCGRRKEAGGFIARVMEGDRIDVMGGADEPG